METKPFVLPTALLVGVIATLAFLVSGCSDDGGTTLPNLSDALPSSQVVDGSSSSASDPTNGSSTGTSDPVSSSTVATSSAGDPQETGDCGTVQGTIPADNGCVRYSGRVNFADNSAEFNWPGIVIEAKFEGTSLALDLTAGDNIWFDIYIDGAKLPTLAPPPGKTNTFTLGSLRTYNGVENYTVASGLADGAHTFKMVKRSETNFSSIVLKNLILDDGKKLLPLPPRPDRRIEIIGDSYSVGYGVEAVSKTDPTKQDASGRTCNDEEFHAYTNSAKAYGPVAADLLGAEYQLNAYSGLGMVRNYSGNTAYLPYPGYYDRILQHTEQPKYDPNHWHPHVVVILLGTNDFSTPLGGGEVYKSKEELYVAYRTAYKEFLAQIRAAHPGVKFILGATNLWDSVTGAPNDDIKIQVQQIIAEENAAGHNDMEYQLFLNQTGYGCGWHPDIRTQELWGGYVANRIRTMMGWD